MPAVVSRFHGGTDRKRKAHPKSRKGCGNCKLRRIKCDESKPRCKKCLSYGVSCDYDGSSSSLDLAASGSFQVNLDRPSPAEKVIDFGAPPQKTPVSMNRIMAGMVNDSLRAARTSSKSPILPAGTPFPSFSETDLDVVKRFQERTVSTIGNSRTAPTYRDCIAHLAFSHPFLMHMVFSLTLMHDAHLAAPYTEDAATSFQHASLQHWNTATKQFNHILSQPIPPSYRDAVWATGALLGAAVFAYVETSNPDEAWPLKPWDPTDLDWLKLSEGKKAIWTVANPTRPDSVFNAVSKDIKAIRSLPMALDLEPSSLSDRLKRLFDITDASTTQNNAYYFPVRVLARLEGMTPDHDNILHFLYFMAMMPLDFRNLLERKDPRALLLLLWWFRKLECSELWWLVKRARVEGRAIEIWLDRWYGGEDGLTRMFESMRKTGFEEVPDELPLVRDWIKESNDATCPVQ